VVILLLSSLPYLVGYESQTPDLVFSGAVFDRMDYAVHLSTMHLGERGEWAYRLRMTSEEQPGAYIKLAYVFLGQAARWSGLSLPAMYQLGRLASGVLAGIAVYLLAAHLFAEILWRRLAFLLAFLGSGLGWLMLILGAQPQAGISPVDFWLVDAYLFFGLLVFPHFVLVTALLAGMAACYLSYLRRPRAWKVAAAAILGLLIQPVQPFAPILGDLAIAGAWFTHTWRVGRFSWRSLGPPLLIGLAQAPLLLYHLRVVSADPVWEGFTRQNITASPPISYYLWGFGLLWPPALAGAWFFARRLFSTQAASSEPTSISAQAGVGAVLAWCAGALALAYTPALLQRRFMLAYSLPLALLAVSGLRELARLSFPVSWAALRRLFPARRPASLGLLYVLLASLSTFYLASGYSLVLAARPPGFFHPAALVQAVDWLASSAGPEEVVFSAEETGQLVAARAGLPVYLGHPIETLDYPLKTKAVSAFYQGEAGVEILHAGRARWVIFGPYERKIEPDLRGFPESDGGLKEVYRNPSVTIYQVAP
jgi:hypothetical protein